MPYKFTSKTNIFLIILLIFTMFPLTVFAQDGTQTFTTDDGLSFEFPDSWEAQSIGGLVFITSSGDTMFSDTVAAGDVLVLVMGSDTLAEEYGEFDDLGAAIEELSTSLATDGEDLSIEEISVGGHSGFRAEMTDEFGKNVFLLLEIDGQFAAVIGVTNPDDFANQEATILAIAESLRYDGAEPTEGGTDFDFGDFDEPPSAEPTVGNEIIVWQQQHPVSEDIINEFGSVVAMSVNGDTVFVTDGLNLANIDGEGNINNFVASGQFTFINVFAAADDGSLWAGTFADDSLIHFDGSLTAIEGWNNSDFDTPIFGDILGVQEIALSPDGDLYMFTGRFDEEFNTNGTVLVWSDGAFVREFSVEGENEFGVASFSFDSQIAFMPDGNILMVDSSANMKVIDTDGNVIRDDFPIGFESGIFGVNDAAVAPDGSIILATFDGITRLSPDGEIIDTFGTTHDFEFDSEAPEFELGQFSSTGPLAVGILSDGTVIAIDSNGGYNLVIRLDFSLAE